MGVAEEVLSECGQRMWVNSNVGRCLARFSTVSGYDVSDEAGNIVAYKVGNMGADDFADFASKVKETHGYALTKQVKV